MKRVKSMRAVAVLLAAATVIFVAGGCSKGSSAGKSSSNASTSSTGMVSDKPVTFTMLYGDNPNYPFKADWATLKEMTKDTNVTLNCTVVPESDFATKRTLTLNSGNIPDIVAESPETVISDYALNGILLPMSDYVSQMPNFQKFVKDNNYTADLNNLKESNGKWYSLPCNAQDTAYQNYLMYIRQDIFDKNNIKVPTTWDEFYTACAKLKQIYPNSTPWMNKYNTDNLIAQIEGAFNVNTSANNELMHYDTKTQKWSFAPASSDYKAMLQELNKFLSAGLLNKQFNTLDKNTFVQNALTGQAFIWGDWADNEATYTQQGPKNDPNYKISCIAPMKGPSGSNKWTGINRVNTGWVLPTTDKSKSNFKTLLKFVDWFYSQQGTDVFTWGAEGTTYSVANGVKTYNKDILTIRNLQGTVIPFASYGVLNNSLTVVKPYDWYKNNYMSESAAKVEDTIVKNNLLMPVEPNVAFSADDKEQVTMLTSTLNDYVKSMREKFIFGSANFSDWDKFVSDCNSKGAQKLVDYYTKQYKAAQKSK